VSLSDFYSPNDCGSALFNKRDMPQLLGAELQQAGTDQAGRSFPLGATVLAEGVNFSVFSRQATRVELLLFDDAAAARPVRVIDLEPRTHRTYHYWHVFVPSIGPGQVYGYRGCRARRVCAARSG
jgi:pullulanase/glycogen debranching enzyme